MFGSIERFIGILIEHYGGAFPTWLSPVQCRVLPVNGEFHSEYARKVEEALKEAKVRVEVDDDNEKLGYRLRKAQVEKVPFTLVIGENECKDGTVTYRVYGDQKQITVSLEEFIKLIRASIDSKARY